MFNIKSDNYQNVGMEDYNNIFDGIFPHFTTVTKKELGLEQFPWIRTIFMFLDPN